MRFKWLVLPVAMTAVLLSSGCGGGKDIETDYDTDGPIGGYEDDLGGYGEILDGDVLQSGTPFNMDDSLVSVPSDFSAVLFGYDSFQLAPREMAKVDEVATYMNQDRGLKLIVEGHCDERGSREYNLSLGDRRSLAVRSYLVNLGVDAMRVQTQSLGEESPLDPGHNEAAWRLNRRAEFKFFR